MAGLYVKNAGKWYLPKSIWVKYSGTWRVCNNVYIKHGGSWREMIKSVSLTSNRTNFNLYDHVGRPSQPLSLIFNINAGVTISSYDVLAKDQYGREQRFNIAPRTTAFTVGNFPSGSTVIINNNGVISGGGGFGGAGGNRLGGPSGLNGSNGGNGGYGIIKGSNNNYDCTIVNTGTIAGGGGGGGGGAGIQESNGGAGGGNGGDGAGITGYSASQGQAGGAGQCSTFVIIGGADLVKCAWDGGAGGSNGANGIKGVGTFNAIAGNGGVGRPAILKSGIEIAVAGNIDGGIG